MTDLIRPALYQAYHKMENLTSEEPMEAYDVVGPICESSDVFGKAIDLNKVKRGDLIALRSAGSNGLLQGINRMREPVKNALIALVLHIGLLVVLMYVFKLNIYAVVYANAFFGLLMCVLNAHSVKKYSGYRQEIRRTFVIPGISALIMGVAVYLSYQLALYLLRVNAIATVFSILIGVIVYAVVLLLLKGLTEEEILKFPKGAALVRLARKMHLLR